MRLELHFESILDIQNFGGSAPSELYIGAIANGKSHSVSQSESAHSRIVRFMWHNYNNDLQIFKTLLSLVVIIYLISYRMLLTEVISGVHN